MSKSPKTAVKKKKKSGSGSKLVKWGLKLTAVLSSNVVRVIVSVLLLLLALVILVCEISYLFTWKQDLSLLTQPDLGVAANLCGNFGFNLAHFFIARLLGLGAFFLPVLMGALAIRCMRRKGEGIFKMLVNILWGAISISLLCAFLCEFIPSAGYVFGSGLGGSMGVQMTKWLQLLTGPVGTGAIIVLLLLVWGILLDGRVAERIGSFFDRLFVPKPKTVDLGDGLTIAMQEESAAPDLVPIEIEGNDSEDEEEGEDEEEDEEEGDETEAVNEPDETFGEVEEPMPEDDMGIKIEVIPAKDETDPDNMPDDKWRQRYDPRLSLSHYNFPPISLLKDYSSSEVRVSQEEINANSQRIVNCLKNYKIGVEGIKVKTGPTVTLYMIVPAPGVRIASVMRLEDDIARSLAATGVRVCQVPGTNYIGIEVANEKPSIVGMRSLLNDTAFQATKYELPIAIGKTISNEVYSFDLAKVPHLLVAGATGMGKSVGLNTIIASLLYRKHPSELKFVLVDPKMVELSLYGKLLNHYLAKMPEAEEAVITDTQKVIYTLMSLCKLMDDRYLLLKAAGVRNLKEYNEKFLSRQLNPLKGHEYMTYIVVIIDEYADLMMTAGREVEDPIIRLAQKARAVGIHLIIATQRPTTNFITGSIKANFPGRIAFKVISSVDSKTILDQTGANQLIGKGDMLVLTGSADLTRVQCAFIDTPEVSALVDYIQKQQAFPTPYILPDYVPESEAPGGTSGGDAASRDELFADAARLIVSEGVGSTSLIQRKMNLGYNRAGRIMDQLHDAGIVGPSEGSKPRQVLISSLESLEFILGKDDAI